MSSTKMLRKSLLESQNIKLQEECSFLKERFHLVRRKLSQDTALPTPVTSELNNLKQRLEIYKSEYESLSKTINTLKSKSSTLDLETQIQAQESKLRSLERSNKILSQSMNLNSKPKDPTQDLYQEISTLKSLVSKLEQSSIETQKQLQIKESKFSELFQELQTLQSLAPVPKVRFSSKGKAKEYLKSLNKAYSQNISKYLNVISGLETQLEELKNQETILQSTYIKKRQQHRLILTMGESGVYENSENNPVALDVKFYYKPTIKYLYI